MSKDAIEKLLLLGPEPATLENNNLATVWRWAEPRLPVYMAPEFDGTRVIADYSSEDLKDEESDNDHSRRLAAIPGTFVLDGIMSDGVYWIDDILFLDGEVLDKPYSERLNILQSFYYQYLENSDLFTEGLVFHVHNQSDMELYTDWISNMGFSTGISLRSSMYSFTGDQSSNWIVLQSIRKLCESSTSDVELNQPLDIKVDKVFKSDEDQQLVMAVVLEPDTVDAQDDVVSKETIETAAHEFMIKHRTVGFRHVSKAPADVVESYIAPADFEISGEKVTKGSWLMTVKINDDDLWAEVKKGNLNAFSIGGYGVREEIG